MTTLHLYNTLTRQQEKFLPENTSRVTFYTCGPTVYDDAHIGNFRAFLAADLLRRWIESPLCEIQAPDGDTHRGPREVVHVMNITDVGHMTDDAAADGSGEDKMALAGRRIAEAKKAGTLPQDADVDPQNPYAIAAFYAGRFIEDAARLGLKVAREAEREPWRMPRATAAVPRMIEWIAELIAKGHAYVAGESGARAVYFDVRSFPSYGRLSGNTLDDIRGGAGGRVSDANQSAKKHPADFLLWKEDASHIMKWDSPWGAGYPGWHIECSVMAGDALAPDTGVIDLHSGGEDNIFPHHECERAQSCCHSGQPEFARHWLHARFLQVEGEKMSKSKGNFFTARDLFAKGHEPASVRLELIKTHYRSNANFTEQGLKDSARIVERWRTFADRARASSIPGERNDAVADAFASAMSDDLNIAGALGVVNAWLGQTPEPTQADAALLAEFDAVLGLLELERAARAETAIGVFAAGLEPDAEVERLLTERRDARAGKDFARADAIRTELTSRGYAIKDMPGGRVEVTRA